MFKRVTSTQKREQAVEANVQQRISRDRDGNCRSRKQGGAFLAAISGVIYIMANRPLQRMAAKERADAAQTLADTQKAAVQTQLELVNTNLELTAAKTRLAEIQERIQDRVLSNAQVEMLVSELSGMKVRIADGAGTRDDMCIAQIVNRRYDEESARFATALREMFVKARWNTTRGERLPEPEFPMPDGVTMFARYEEGEIHVCGQTAAAIRLEQLWDEVTRTYDVDAWCGYGSDVYRCDAERDIFDRICAAHSTVRSR